jgi:hypothetical protein
LAGEDAVKAGGERYLPRLDARCDEEFIAYRKRAAFFNATARTAEGYIGLICRRPPFIDIPETVGRTSTSSPFSGPSTLNQKPSTRGQKK